MTDTKNPGIFNGFRNLESIEFKVPMVCLVRGCVSRRRDARYLVSRRVQFDAVKTLKASLNSTLLPSKKITNCILS
jgi:hypothetical protein